MELRPRDWQDWQETHKPPQWFVEFALTVDAMLVHLHREIMDLAKTGGKIMASVEELQASYDALKGSVDEAAQRVSTDLANATSALVALQQQVADLQAQLAAGQGIDPAALDNLKSELDNATAAVAAIDPAPAAPTA